MDNITLTDEQLTSLDLTDNTVEALEALRTLAIDEQERRARRAQVPLDIAAQAKRFVEDGGDPEEIRTALTDAFPA